VNFCVPSTFQGVSRDPCLVAERNIVVDDLSNRYAKFEFVVIMTLCPHLLQITSSLPAWNYLRGYSVELLPNLGGLASHRVPRLIQPT
jgi:hypothetical protein